MGITLKGPLKGKKAVNAAYGTLFGKKPRLVRVNNISMDAELIGKNMLFLYSHDKPGVIANLAKLLAARNINVGGMHFGRESVGGLSDCLLDLDEKVGDDVLDAMARLPNVLEVKRIEFA